jgi:hypothetical protein
MRFKATLAISVAALVVGPSQASANTFEVSGVAATPAAVQAAQPSGPWFEGWQFERKAVCIESNIPKAPLAAVASMYRVYGIRVSVRFALGQCAAAGFARSQVVPFTAYKADNNMCGGAVAPYWPGTGFLANPAVHINMQPDTRQPNGTTRYYSRCRTGAEWTDEFAHELGHLFGLTHNQPAASSIERDGHTTDPYDRWRLGLIYQNNPY